MTGAPAELNAPPAAVVWHELECGAYRADLETWRTLAAGSSPDGGTPARVLDIGAGTGRVALALARAGHPVTALDLDPVLVAELRRRAGSLPVSAFTADARTFSLDQTDHDLGLVPMQTIQLLRGREERRSLLERARAHLRPGALLAMAIVTDVDDFDSRRGGRGPAPDQERVDGRLYVSRAVLVAVGPDHIRIERERLIEPRPASEGAAPAPELDVIELERLSEGQLHEEAQAIGLEPQPGIEIAETYEHTASQVVIVRV
jgi:SAM-dependent methyltransferase